MEKTYFWRKEIVNNPVYGEKSEEVFGYHLFDKALSNDKEDFIFDQRVRGVFEVRFCDGNKLSRGDIIYTKLAIKELVTSLLMKGGWRFRPPMEVEPPRHIKNG